MAKNPILDSFNTVLLDYYNKGLFTEALQYLNQQAAACEDVDTAEAICLYSPFFLFLQTNQKNSLCKRNLDLSSKLRERFQDQRRFLVLPHNFDLVMPKNKSEQTLMLNALQAEATAFLSLLAEGVPTTLLGQYSFYWLSRFKTLGENGLINHLLDTDLPERLRFNDALIDISKLLFKERYLSIGTEPQDRLEFIETFRIQKTTYWQHYFLLMLKSNDLEAIRQIAELGIAIGADIYLASRDAKADVLIECLFGHLLPIAKHQPLAVSELLSSSLGRFITSIQTIEHKKALMVDPASYLSAENVRLEADDPIFCIPFLRNPPIHLEEIGEEAKLTSKIAIQFEILSLALLSQLDSIALEPSKRSLLLIEFISNFFLIALSIEPKTVKRIFLNVLNTMNKQFPDAGEINQELTRDFFRLSVAQPTAEAQESADQRIQELLAHSTEPAPSFQTYILALMVLHQRKLQNPKQLLELTNGLLNALDRSHPSLSMIELFPRQLSTRYSPIVSVVEPDELLRRALAAFPKKLLPIYLLFRLQQFNLHIVYKEAVHAVLLLKKVLNPAEKGQNLFFNALRRLLDLCQSFKLELRSLENILPAVNLEQDEPAFLKKKNTVFSKHPLSGLLEPGPIFSTIALLLKLQVLQEDRQKVALQLRKIKGAATDFDSEMRYSHSVLLMALTDSAFALQIIPEQLKQLVLKFMQINQIQLESDASYLAETYQEPRYLFFVAVQRAIVNYHYQHAAPSHNAAKAAENTLQPLKTLFKTDNLKRALSGLTEAEKLIILQSKSEIEAWFLGGLEEAAPELLERFFLLVEGMDLAPNHSAEVSDFSSEEESLTRKKDKGPISQDQELEPEDSNPSPKSEKDVIVPGAAAEDKALTALPQRSRPRSFKPQWFPNTITAAAANPLKEQTAGKSQSFFAGARKAQKGSNRLLEEKLAKLKAGYYEGKSGYVAPTKEELLAEDKIYRRAKRYFDKALNYFPISAYFAAIFARNALILVANQASPRCCNLMANLVEFIDQCQKTTLSLEDSDFGPFDIVKHYERLQICEHIAELIWEHEIAIALAIINDCRRRITRSPTKNASETLLLKLSELESSAASREELETYRKQEHEEIQQLHTISQSLFPKKRTAADRPENRGLTKLQAAK